MSPQLNRWWMAGGYLPSPDGRAPRVICGLERLGLEMIRHRILIRYGTPIDGKAACSYWWRPEIVLAPWLFDCDADAIRYVLWHELGHCRTGKASDDRVQAWQRRYAGLLLPAWAA